MQFRQVIFLLLLFECILLSSLSLAGLNHSIDGLPVLHVVQLNCYTCDVTKKDMAKMEHHECMTEDKVKKIVEDAALEGIYPGWNLNADGKRTFKSNTYLLALLKYFASI